MSGLLTIISQKKRKLDSLQPFSSDVLEELEKWLRVELTYSSNAIEGNTLSRLETAEVLEKGVSAVISGKALKDQLEAVNHAKAIDVIKELAKSRKSHQYITEADIKTIHKIILTGIDDRWAGIYRQIDVFIRGADVEFPQPKEIYHLMREFVDWLSSAQGAHPVRVASDAHFKFVSIHPFVDGNGRTARLLMNLILIINGYPMAIIRNEERTEYLNAVYKGQKEHDLTNLYEIIEKSVDRSLDAYLNKAQNKSFIQPLMKDIKQVKIPKKNLLKIGELAKATGETVATIRFWTNEGLLTVSAYSPGGYQLYSKDMTVVVKKIRKLQDTDRRTLSEIKEIIKI